MSQEDKKQKEKNTTIVVYGSLVVVLTFLAVYIYNSKTNSLNNAISDSNNIGVDTESNNGTSTDANLNSQLDKQTQVSEPLIREFAMTSKDYEYDLKEIKVKKGDVVKIFLTNAMGDHDFVIDEYNLKTTVLKENESENIEFAADKAGEFEYYCSVGNHRQMGMVGKLIVEE